MKSFNLIITVLLLVPTNWALSMASSGPDSVSSLSLSSNTGSELNSKDPSSVAATLGSLYRKSRQSRCVRCYYDDRYRDDHSYGRINDDRSRNWYYPNERYDRYDDRGRYGNDRDYDRYYNSYNGYYRDRTDDRYSTRTYDRYDRDRYDSRGYNDRSPSENRGYGYDNRDRYFSNDRYNDYYHGDRQRDRYSGSSYDRGSYDRGSYDRYGSGNDRYDDRYSTRYDFRNYRPWDETYRGQSGFDNSGRGYYFANDRPNDYYDPPYRSRPSGPSTSGSGYLPGDSKEQSRPSNGYPNSRPGSSPSSSSSLSSSSPPSSGSDYDNRPRDDVTVGAGPGGGGSGSVNSGGDNNNGYSGGSWSYVNDREKDASYKGGIRDKDNQSSSYGGGRGRPLGGSYLLDRDTNVPPMMSNPDKPGDSQSSDTPTASKLSSPPSSSSASSASAPSSTDEHIPETKDSN